MQPPAVFLDVWSIFLILGITQGLVLAVMLIINKKGNHLANRFMAGIIFFLVWMQAEFLAVRSAFDVGFELFYGTRYGAWMLLGPLFYLYAFILVSEKFTIRRSYYLHFLPFLIFSLSIPAIFDEPVYHHAISYGMLTPIRFDFGDVTSLQSLYGWVFLLQFAHLAVYIALTTKVFMQYSQRAKNTLSNLDKINVNWLKYLSIGLSVIVISSIIFYVILFDSELYTRFMDYTYVIPLTFVVYAIGIKAMKQPEIYYGEISNGNGRNGNGKKYATSTLTDDTAQKCLEQLLQYMESEKPFLDNDLKLPVLAEKLQIPYNHLSQLINEKLDSNFFDFVNKYRVDEAKIKMADPSEDEFTLLKIAFDVGFNSKTAFNRAFKKHASMTPTQYKKNIS